MVERLLVIGLDGASFNVLDELAEKGHIPNIAGLIKRGARANLETTFPPITAVAWSSFMTGTNPGKHGIFEFVMRDNSSRELAVNASFRHGRAIWDLLSDAGKRVVVHNFPCTYPPHPLNGLMIADFMTPRGRRDFTYPVELLAEIEDRFGPYRLHLHQTYANGNVEGVLDELDDELDYKAKVAQYLMQRSEWDCFFQYFWGTDRIQHELWHILDEAHPRHNKSEARRYRERVFDYFRRVDSTVGDLIEMAGKETLVWIASDHGFGPVHKYCSFNIWLLHEGFLRLKPDVATRLKRVLFNLGITPELAFRIIKKLPLGGLRPSRGVSQQPGASKLIRTLFLSFDDVDWDRTVAFSKGNYGQIYINLKGRELRGSVDPAEYEEVCGRIMARLRELKDPGTGAPWIDRVFRREEIYNGPRLPDAPDIAFLPKDMRYLALGNADFTSNRFIADAFGISGSHRMHGVMISAGGPIRSGISIAEAGIADIAPTILYLLNQQVPKDMDGSVIREIIADEYLRANPVTFGADYTTEGEEAVGFTAEENQEVIDRLRGLGYIG